MSYVLDALRKADAERERGAVPGLHAQPVLTPTADEDAVPAARLAPWMGGALVLGVAAAAAWWWVGREPEPAARAAVATAPAVSTAPAPVVSAAPPPPLPTPAPALPAPAPPRSLPPVPAPLERAPAPPAPVARSTPPPPPAATPGTAAPTAGPAVAASPRAVAPRAAPAAASAAEPRIMGAGELPDAVRRELPPLKVGGSIYSDDRAARFVIIDGRVLHEGEEIAPGLRVEQIRLKSALLRYKDWRWSIAF